MSEPMKRIDRLQRATEAEQEKYRAEEARMAKSEATQEEQAAPLQNEPAPWWTRTPTADPSGDPARPRSGERGTAEAPRSARAPLMGVSAEAPASSGPAPAPAPVARRQGPPPVSTPGLAKALHDERRRLEAQRAHLETRYREIEEQVAAIQQRIGHVDALLGGEASAGPPAELRSIGSRHSDGAAAAA